MQIKIIEREGIAEAIEEATGTFFSGNRAVVESHFEGHAEGNSTTLFGYKTGELIGILTIRWQTRNPLLRRQNIPLIQNIEIKHDRRGQGLGNELMEHAERFAAARTDRIAICVSISEAFGAAQRLYVKRGYIPDGQGVTKVYEPTEKDGLARLEPLRDGQTVRVDGSLQLWLIKDLTNKSQSQA
jgi:ribosomal protein S18 acetylase RimI-like enzyme